MPNTREKLIELVTAALCNQSAEEVADHLISNGVTIEDDHHWATEQAYKNGYEDGKPKWIPVSERLPDKNDDVLCSRGNHIGALIDVYTYKGDDQWEDSYGYFSTAEYEGITHWMPLPEPPKGE